MKQLLSVFIFILVFANIYSQNKSDRDMPNWLFEFGNGYIVGFGNGTSIQEAKQNAILNIKSQIASSVAATISSSTEFKTNSITINNIERQVQAFQDITTSKTGEQGVLMGISEINSTDHYWERKINKNKQITYKFYLRYPFSQFDLSDLVSQYKRKDIELTEELEQARLKINNIESIDDIDECYTIFNYLSRIFTDHRKVKAQLGIDKCATIISRIDIRDINSTVGHIRYQLFIDNKSITTNKKPDLLSDCIYIEKESHNDGVYDIAYRFDNCAEGNNSVKINYNFTSGKISKTFSFNVAEQKVKIKLIDKISIRDGIIRDDSVFKSICFISLMSKNLDSVSIKSVTLEWNGFTCTVPLRKIIKGYGIHEISFPLPAIPRVLTSTRVNAEKAINGYIEFQIPGKINKDVQRLKIYENEYATNW